MSTSLKRLVTIITTLALAAGLALSTSVPAQASKPTKPTYTYDVVRGVTNDPAAQAELARLNEILGADWVARRQAAVQRLRIEQSPATAAVMRYLNGQAACAPTKIDKYVAKSVRGVPKKVLFALVSLAALDLPTIEAIVFGKESNRREFGLPKGASGLGKTMGKLQKFWDIRGKKIQLMGMHGSMLVNKSRVVRTYRKGFGLSASQANRTAAVLIKYMNKSKKLKRGNNPLFTLNAFAFTGKGQRGWVKRIKDRIVFGDGIVGFIKYARTPKAADYILAHEYGHHIQFQKNMATDYGSSPEATRQAELMADAFGGYFVAHKKGLKGSAKVLKQSKEAAFQVGDCGTTSPGHHGTPAQREVTMGWAYSVAKGQNRADKSRTIEAAFLAVLPQILLY